MELRSALQCVCRTTVAAASMASARPNMAVGRHALFSTSARAQYQPPSNPYVSSRSRLESLRVALSNRKPAAAAGGPAAATTSSSSVLPPRPPTANDNPWTIVDAINKDSNAPPSGSGALYSSSKPSSPMQTWNETDFETRHMAPQQELNIRLRPSTGRTFYVSGHQDFAGALKQLNRAVMQNQVKKDVRLQRFHERPALKRKRNLRERWRRRFKEGFKAAVNRAFELKNQGW
ncbi:hypothetical protein QBC32DRAFT_336688 [Pseudoneurospora amorphoporcata]|uniref:Ribosomal protein S21 n=1 Tax=Pseudoneurospora amorphoporcata TaxID=241081 RepID=A0AAN6SIJ4_9PEZI|nr:hypothetical protein QBC32DRAFT_336688 [Pseudoneurospora amorphoporcata]